MSKSKSRISILSFRFSSFPALFLIALTLCLPLSAGSAVSASILDNTRSRAERALREGKYELAEKLFREAIAKDERDNVARLGLSQTLLKMRRLAEAYEHVEHVLAVEPLAARAHALLGTILLANGDFRQSMEEFRMALSLKSDEALAVAGQAMVDYYENRLSASLVGLRHAVYLSPSEPDFLFKLAQAAARSESYKEAADAYERFLRVAPRTDDDRRSRIRGLIGFLRYLGNQTTLYNVSGASEISVPFDMPNNRPIIKVRANGRKEPLRFVLDTGSGISVISDETAKLLGIKPIARGGMARGVGGKFEIIYGFLRSLEIGEARIENVPVYIRHFYHDKIPVDGYIGLSAIMKYVTTVDYGARTFSLRRQHVSDNRAASASSSGIEIPTRTTSSGFLSGEVKVEGISRPFNFIIDTGASISVVSERLMELEEMSSFKHPTRMRVYGAAGVAEDVQTLILPRVVLGAYAREKLDVAVLNLDPVNETTGFVQSGIIGGNFLRHFRVTFDFKRSVILLEPLNPAGSVIDGKTRAVTVGAGQP